MHQIIKCLCFSILVFMLTPLAAEASSQNCTQWLARIISMQGKVDTQFSGNNLWQPTAQDQTFCRGDKIRTARNSRVTLFLSNESRANLDQNTTLTFVSPKKARPSWYLNLIEGAAFFRSRQPHKLDIHTPFINAVHQGTEFLVTVTDQHTEISVFDGQVAAHNKNGEILIKKGHNGIASLNQPPYIQPLIIRPEDAVQWTLYYPPIIDAQDFQSTFSDDLQKSMQAYQQGNISQALAYLNNIAEAKQSINFLALKASLLLSVGSVDDALQVIKQIQNMDSNNSYAFALQSIIAVTKNKNHKALEIAQKAATLNSESAVLQIALSYAHQANFNIEAAMKATQEAIRLSPNNALAWARLSELQLSLGERNNALKSAQKAIEFNPKLARTHTILGFAYLAEIDIDQAKNAFNQAIALNSADPLARLGLALSKIRKGDVEQGTADLETAVSLAPDNAIMRSYLGKAYYELRNNDYAATELRLAKEMDPNDPTPWFYDAIRKQTSNQPVEALHDMQTAIELNDNRGVYRSKLLLDEDAAARSANLARIYQDLGFDRLALKQAWTSLGQDYTNPSAHRFLSDTLQGRPRQRIARASELLQAQLFQPINTVPVQPQLTSENIGILNSTGPGSLSSNEYDPLFTSNGAHILLNGAVGSNNTLTDSAIVTGLYDQLSLSFGQFHFQTDGFRKNDDYKQNIYNAFAQLAITPDLNVQVEFKREDVTAGDVPLRFDNIHQQNLRQTIDQDSARLGMRYKINNEQDFIFSGMLTRFKEIQSNSIEDFRALPGFFGTTETTETISEINTFKETGYQIEVQHLFHPDSFDLITGFGFLNLDAEIPSITQTDIVESFISSVPFIPSSPPVRLPTSISTSERKSETNYFNGYIYSNFEIIDGLISTLGVSFDSYNDRLFDKNQFNPKVGLIWNPANDLSIRAATFKTLKRPLATSQTIEPTQVAGFNQFYDGNDGTSAWFYGFGLDYQPFKDVYMGGEVTWRDTKQPIITGNDVSTNSRDESSHLAYLYLTLSEWASFSSEYKFDEFRTERIVQSPSLGSFVTSLATHSVPLSLNFYHISGLFSKISATYVNQNVHFVDNVNSTSNSSDDFWLFNTSIGFRFPKKLGSLSLEVRNVFNNNSFRYHSTFDASGPRLTKFVPEQEFFFKLNITY